MNPKDFNAKKNDKKNKSGLKNGVQQVYVLPPNLLQKLGINLGSVENSQLCPNLEQAKSSEVNVTYNKYASSSSHLLTSVTKSSHSHDETSITQTASLMKQSVFLSPTFNNTISSFPNSPKNQCVQEPYRNVNYDTHNFNTQKVINNLAEKIKTPLANSVSDVEDKEYYSKSPEKSCNNKNQVFSSDKNENSQLDCETEYINKLPEKCSQNKDQVDPSTKNDNLQADCEKEYCNELPEESSQYKHQDPCVKNENLQVACKKEYCNELLKKSSQNKHQVDSSTKNDNLQADCEKEYCNKLSELSSQNKGKLEPSVKNENLQVDCEKEYCNKLPEKSTKNKNQVKPSIKNEILRVDCEKEYYKLPEQSSQNEDQVEPSIKNETLMEDCKKALDSSKHYKLNESKNTINIISQEIITFSKLNELKAHIPKNKDLVPASLDTIIVKKRRNIIGPQTFNSSTVTESITDCSVMKLDKPKEALINDISTSVASITYSNSSEIIQKAEFEECLDSNAQNVCDSDINKNQQFISIINKNISNRECSAEEKKQFIITDVVESGNNEIVLHDVMDKTIHKASVKKLLKNNEMKRIFNTNTNSNSENNVCIKTVTNSYYQEVLSSSVSQDEINNASLNEVDINDITSNSKRTLLDDTILTKDQFDNKVSDGGNTKTTPTTSSENTFETSKIQQDDRKKIKSYKDTTERLSGDTFKLGSNYNENKSNNSEIQTSIVRKICPSIVLTNDFYDVNETECVVPAPRTYGGISQLKKGAFKKSSDVISGNVLDFKNKVLNKVPQDLENNVIIVSEKERQLENKLSDTNVNNNTLTNMGNNRKINNAKIQATPVQRVSESVKDLMEDLESKQKCSMSFIRINEDESNNLKMTLDPERKKLVSKLCIQGVEKPGGIAINERERIRTYSNKKKHKLLDDSVVTTDIKHNFEHSFSNKSHMNSPENVTNIQSFCVCNDFGILSDDMCDGSYEHVHFLQRRSLDCSSDVIYSMFNNDENNHETICYNENSEENHINLNETTDKVLGYICWNQASSVQNNFDTVDKHGILPTDWESAQNVDQDVSVHKETNIKCEMIVKEENDLISNQNFTSDVGNETRKNDLENETKLLQKRKIFHDDVTDSKTKYRLVMCSLCKEMIKECNLEEHVAKHGFIYSKGSKNIEYSNNNSNEDTVVKCGVCNVDVRNINWARHIADFHDYIAWKIGEKSVDVNNVQDIEDHLNCTVKQLGQLVCRTCKMAFKYGKPFLHHISKCCRALKNVVTCAVCHHHVDGCLWIEHIAKHNYLAWKTSEKKIDFNDANKLREHLKKIVKAVGILICANCGFEFEKNSKRFARHLESCKKNDVPAENDNIKCGVCKAVTTPDQWIVHIKDQHEYLAWKEGETPLDFKNEMTQQNHLYNILQKYGPLECAKCGKSRKYVKMYLKHIKSCTGPDPDKVTEDWDALLDIPYADNTISEGSTVTCGVCLKEIEADGWVEHIKMDHNYVAWQVGRKPLNLEDVEVVHRYLNQVVQILGSLVCAKCGKACKYTKTYLQHIQSCTGPTESSMKDDTNETPNRCRRSTDANETVTDAADSTIDSSKDFPVLDDIQGVVKCDVCKQEMDSKLWVNHIQMEHNYKAWREGQKPVDLQDEVAVKQHLYDILKKVGQLVCAKCGMARKYVKLYLQHIESCTGEISNNVNQDDFIKCGVCQKQIKDSMWIKHIEMNHEYIAWKDSEAPLDVNNYDAIWQHLMNVIKLGGALRCTNCKIKRKYPKAFLLHVKECYGKEYSFLSGEKCENSTLNDTHLSDVDTTLEETVLEEDSDGSGLVNHIRQQHNHLAWRDGENPIESSMNDTVTPSKRCRRAIDANETVTDAVDSLIDSSNDFPVLDDVQGVVKCDVCKQEMDSKLWVNHIQKEHNYKAWREGQKSVDLQDEVAVKQHLYDILKKVGQLVCAKCGMVRKYVKLYLQHIESCTGEISNNGNQYSCLSGKKCENSTLNDTHLSDVDTTLEETVIEDSGDGSGLVKCGVCSEEMQAQTWINHIRQQHNYLAWRDGDNPIDLESETSIKEHLRHIVQKYGGLTCSKCGLVRKKVLMFYRHAKTCNGTVPDETMTIEREFKSKGETVKCAVCQAEMNDSVWIAHIADKHDYLAWRKGEEPLDVNDDMLIRDYLNKIINYTGELICSKCGRSRKYARSYLTHLRGCTGAEEDANDTNKEPIPKKLTGMMVTCGLCNQGMDDSMWMDHIKEHNYVAWKKDDPPLVLEDEDAVRSYLYSVMEKTGQLVCSKCGTVRKYVKPYVQHLETCKRVTWETIKRSTIKLKKEKGDIVKCAVCLAELDNTEWINHISEHHNYLAWRDRDPEINLEDEEEVRSHLKKIIEEEGYLQCAKCGIQRKYPKIYLAHVNDCDGTTETDAGDVSYRESAIFNDMDTDDSDVKSVKCGVCQEEVLKAQWIEHIQKEHKYLAWQDGKTPIDVNDKEAVYNYLYLISHKYNGLVCGECGLVRKYVKPYLSHVRSCSGKSDYNTDEILECGVCGQKVVGRSWRSHAMNEHYNIAWFAGSAPIEMRNFSKVEKCLKDYFEHKHKMVCYSCGMSRSSVIGFYAHILTCGKTDEEIDQVKDLCEICNQKFLFIYKTQHYRAHRNQELMTERKILAEQKRLEQAQEALNLGPRRAAEIAKNVIGDYAAKLSSSNTNRCASCGFESESKDDLLKHYCLKRGIKYEDGNDSDDSIEMNSYFLSESEDSEVDSDISNEEILVATRNVRNREGKYAPKTSKLPFTVKDVKSYFEEAADDFFKMFYKSETLFPQWRACTSELVSEDLVSQYIPPLEESCKARIGKDTWTTLKRFEAINSTDYCAVFTGACIQCMSWVPAAGPESRSLLAAAGHRGADCPRRLPTDIARHPALIQLWDFGDFSEPPKLACGIAHDYGTVWGLDWCPSGARDVLNDENTENDAHPRLGLMAMACSNGSAYILSIPYPEKNPSEIPFCKIKPCVELRITRGTNKYQATSIHWSLEKEYTTILVGYGDGTTAMFDLDTKSPLLMSKDGDMTILYPFHEEKVHNSCVTGLTSNIEGAWCSTSPTGTTGTLGAGGAARARPLRAHTPLAASAGLFAPHWPSVLLSGDDCIGHAASELEWGASGRRTGPVRAAAACPRRALVLTALPPLLVAMRLHPAYAHSTLHKKAVAVINMSPLAKKRSKHTNDELSMKVEPLNYEDAVKSYGIEFKLEKDLEKTMLTNLMSKMQEPSPERFPLADVPVLAYCPSPRHYTKVAVATHAGFIFVIDA